MVWASQRIDFQTQEFYRLIKQKGMLVVWEKSTICPCIMKDTAGQPNFNCSLCSGKGRYWYDPQDIEGIMTNLTEDAKYNQAGEIMAGTNYFTTQATNKLGFWDRVTNIHSIIRYSEILEKGEIGGKDKSRFVPIEVNLLRTIEKEYTSGRDFTFDGVTNRIDWIDVGSDQPKLGEQYTLEYNIHPSWICIDLVNVVRDTYVKQKRPGITHIELPVRAVVRLEFFCFK